MQENIIYNDKLGVCIHLGDCKIPELKKDGVIIRQNKTGKIMSVSNEKYKSMFKAITSIKVQEMKDIK